MGIGKSSNKKSENKYELESLLNESSSGDEKFSSESEEDDEETGIDSDLIINFDEDNEDLERGNPDDIKQALLEQIESSADKQKLEAFEIHMN